MGLLKEILLRAGEKAGQEPLAFEPGALTVFVGPNNSGKSQALSDIATEFSGAPIPKPVVQSITLHPFASATHFLETLRPARIKEDGEPAKTLYFLNMLNGSGSTVFWPAQTIADHYGHPTMPRAMVGATLTTKLDGTTRLTLLRDQQAGDLQSPTNILSKLFVDDAARASLRTELHAAFGRYLVIDPTMPGTLRVRLSPRSPEDSQEEQSLDARARAFHATAQLLSEFSDGVKAYAGILATVLGTHLRIILIDEPEAFLAPPLARRLGALLASTARQRDATVLVSTHSPDFLMGCVESGVSAQIVRLTYSGNYHSVKVTASRRGRTMAQASATVWVS